MDIEQDYIREISQQKIELAKYISIACIVAILFHSFRLGFNYWSLIYLCAFSIYVLLIPKGNIIIAILGLILSLYFSVSMLRNSLDPFLITFIIGLNYGFINGVIGAYAILKINNAQVNA